MATMNVSLPDTIKDWVGTQAGISRYANASDYVRNLIRRDQERVGTLPELQRLIDEGRASGISDRTPEEIRQLGRDRLVAMQG